MLFFLFFGNLSQAAICNSSAAEPYLNFPVSFQHFYGGNPYGGFLLEMKVTLTAVFLGFEGGQIYKLNQNSSFVWGKDYGSNLYSFGVSQDESFLIATL